MKKCGRKTQSGRKCKKFQETKGGKAVFQNGLNCRFHKKKGGGHFDDLPRELVAKVATYLGPEDFARFSKVNRTTRYVSNDRYTNSERVKFMKLTHTEKNELLLESAKRGDLKTFRALFEQGANVNARVNEALGMAAHYGHLAVVRYLVENGANVNANNGLALRLAEAYGNTTVVNYLRSKKCGRKTQSGRKCQK